MKEIAASDDQYDSQENTATTKYSLELLEVFCDTWQMLCLLNDFANLTLSFLFYFSLIFWEI